VLGAAYLAGLAVGYWPDKDAIASQWQMDRVFKPTMTQPERTKVRNTWRRALERAGEWQREEEKQA
jgi:glycerol kinase